jgi:hypothetical protein
MTTIYDSARSVKTARPFGTLPARERRMPFTQADLDWAAQAFGDAEADRELEERALQAEWDDQFRFPAGLCELCGEPADWLDPIYKLCPECLELAEHATTAGQNGHAGLGHRVF